MCQGLGSPVPRPGLLSFLPGDPVLNASLPFRMALHRPARLPILPPELHTCLSSKAVKSWRSTRSFLQS